MPLKPTVGSAGGQQYPVLRSIQKFLQQMAEGDAHAAPTVIKEILQNADDAGASELAVILDERPAPAQLPSEYTDLFEPSLLVRNNAPFYLCELCRRDGKDRDCEHEQRDDFHAIQDVAAGHKRAQATAAGRFGIGFNSVYFLTDTPLLFSRREVHIFDLLHRVFEVEANGWRFSLNDFPTNAPTHVGSIKLVLEWCFPKVALADRSFGDLAIDPSGDYQQAIFRLPLRRTPSGTTAIYDDRFPDTQNRIRVLRDMVDESARSILFLKHVTSISFSVLRERELEAFARVEVTPPPGEFEQFLQQVQELDRQHGLGPRRDCGFDRTIRCRIEGMDAPKETSWKFHVRHTARFNDSELNRLRERLRQNGERAVPWAALAVPLNLEACRLDGEGPARWRVFLPLLEKGPSNCVFNASLFIGPSRQRVEYRLNESDEGRRRTDWNRALVQKALIPLLQKLSMDLPDLARDLLEEHPHEYLSLFPRIAEEEDSDGSLTTFMRQHFGRDTWLLCLPDLWGNRFEIFVDDPIAIEMVAEWFGEYRQRFQHLSTTQRRFVRFALGEALAARVGKTGPVKISRQPSPDVALCILRHQDPPKPRDLTGLVKLAAKAGLSSAIWEAAWALEAADGKLLRYHADNLYVLENADQHDAVAALRRLGLPFSGIAWVKPDEGLTATDLQPRPENIVAPTQTTALELLRRLPEENNHDQLRQAQDIQPVVGFLIKEALTRIPHDARLGFLIRTAYNKSDRRRRGVVLLKPSSPTASESALWEVWFRQLFAEVDPNFAREVNRLLSVHPGVLEMLHARDCQVAVGTMRNALPILHSVRLRAPEVYDLLTAEMNKGEHRSAPQIVASSLLEVADVQWECLSAEEQYTVLALPIHRKPDGGFAPLVPAHGGDPSSVRTAFRLQSDDDIEDAPITLPACQLIQTPNAASRRFYRQRLGLEPHGRVAVLKDVLRQIGGGEGPVNDAMLCYLGYYYEETLRRLDASGDEVETEDARVLRELFSSARTVPCVDGVWRLPRECISAWRVAERLSQQGWPRARVVDLVGQICYGQHVANLQEPARRLVHQLHRLPEVDPGELAGRAITNESSRLSLPDRAKLLDDNWRERPQARVSPSGALKGLEVPVLRGRARLADSELIEPPMPSLPASVLRALAPTAIDLSACAKELGLPAERARAMLEVFGVPRCSVESLDNRLVQRFPEVWSGLGSGEHLQLLGYVGGGELVVRLRETATNLDVVQVAGRPPRWTLPNQILTPRWAETLPPHVPTESQPLLKDLPETVRAVWNDWCDVRSFADVFALVLSGAEGLGDRRSAATGVYRWLESVATQPLPEEFESALRDQRWVLAQRGDSLELCPPSEVILHPAEQVLAGRFWVPALLLPTFARTASRELGFLTAPPATPQSLQQLAECLAERAVSAGVDAAVKAYGLVGQLLGDLDTLDEEWRRLAQRLPVYRAFRPQDRQRTALQIFIGDSGHDADLSSGLVCLRSHSGLPKGILSRYRDLDVPDGPTIEQVLAALASFGSAEPNGGAAYGRLVRSLEELTRDLDLPLDHASLPDLRVLSCAGTYEPISQCYWDDDFGDRRRVAAPHASRLIDTTDRNTQRLVDWVHKRSPRAVTSLRAAARLEVVDEPEPIDSTPELSHLLLPWRQWAQEIVREGSVLADRLARFGLAPTQPFEILPARRIRVRFHLGAGGVIDQAAGWEGPAAIGDGDRRIFVRPPTRRVGSPTDAHGAVEQLDAAIAHEAAILLGGRAILENVEACVAEILATLERPSTVLRNLRRTYRQHFLHQYHDQVADPRFAELFDEYRRTVPSSKRAGELEERMHDLLAEGFVSARREQIRGYGYDEFSVFAELLQNAEDAYIQRAQLGMDMPSTCSIAYRYVEVENEQRVLEVEHRGRPFNYWQHGSTQDRSLSRDVEGVLRSAGSFKPHVESPNTANPEMETIGRFGLGFKSVYLLTDRPEIHSGAWHFAIEAGCLPEEVLPPGDLDEEVTRIRLPLRADVEVLYDTSRLLNLLPFLGMVRRLEFRTDGTAPVEFAVDVKPPIAIGSMLVEQVTISSPAILCDGSLRFIRCRSQNHAGQLALLLARDRNPARWDEVFDCDLFAVLPLKAKLRCGIAASHRFEVQSGRTHLGDPKVNARRFAEIAALLEGLMEGLRACASADTPISDVLTRFWALWGWEQGDTDCESLRKELAKTLVGIAERLSVVPTLDPERPTSLADGPRFFFSELPDAFREAIVSAGVTIPVADFPASALSPAKVVNDRFASSYRRACEYAGILRDRKLVGIGWEEVAKAFRERAWFAEKPGLLSSLAESLNEEQAGKVAAWLALCPVLGEDGRGNAVHVVPGELLSREFPGCEHFPKRFLRRISTVYGCTAIELLKKAGLRAQPSPDDLRDWVLADDVVATESIGILRYLADSDRFRDFWGLGTLFCSPWFPAAERRLSTVDAVEQGLIPEDLLLNDVFRAWLGLSRDQEAPSPEPRPPRRHPHNVLQDLFAWWQTHGAAWTANYEKRIYPTGRPPILRNSFSPRDRGECRQWITLLLLGALHTMGRTRLEQHRDFLRRCEHKGWLDVFADGEHDARRWMQVLEEYLEDSSGMHEYYQWMKQFVVIFQISRWLPEYVGGFLNVNRFMRPFALHEILALRESQSFSSGYDAPALIRALGIGACFVMRELTRLNYLRQPLAHRYCYVPSRRVCTIMKDLGCSNLQMLSPADRSSRIYQFIADHLRNECATFNRSFDLPLLALADDADLQRELLGHVLSSEDDNI